MLLNYEENIIQYMWFCVGIINRCVGNACFKKKTKQMFVYFELKKEDKMIKCL